MNTRAQAEALLTLAESLENSQRAEIEISVPGRCHVLLQSGCALCEPLDLRQGDGVLNGVDLRSLIADLMPKPNGS